MTGNRKRLGEEVGDVAKAADEHDMIVSLAGPGPDPMQAHVGGLGHPLRHRVGSNADGDIVVAEQRGSGLGVAHVGQDFRSSVAMQAAAYKPAYSASATKEQTTGMRVEWQEMGWLTQSSSSVSPR
jgi:hypothetical protein